MTQPPVDPPSPDDQPPPIVPPSPSWYDPSGQQPVSPAPPQPQPPGAWPATAWQQPAWPQPGSPYEQPTKAGTNGFAIAALVFGIVPICFLGIIFGIVALVQTSKSGQKGKGLAIAGLVLNVVWIIGLVTVGIVSTLDNAHRDSTGTITKSGKIAVDELKVGDCFNGLDNIKVGSAIQKLDGVPCSKLHQGEVYAEASISGSSYPGRESLQHGGQAPCLAKLKEVAPQHFANRDIGFIWIYPEKGSWLLGNHHYSCIAIGVGRSTGSITD